MTAKVIRGKVRMIILSDESFAERILRRVRERQLRRRIPHIVYEDEDEEQLEVATEELADDIFEEDEGDCGEDEEW